MTTDSTSKGRVRFSNQGELREGRYRRIAEHFEENNIIDRAYTKYIEVYGEAAELFLLLPGEVSQHVVRRIDGFMRTYARFMRTKSTNFITRITDLSYEYYQSSAHHLLDSIDTPYKEMYNPFDLSHDELKFIVKYKVSHARELFDQYFWGDINELTRSQKKAIIDEFARDNPGAPISHLIEEFFPEPMVNSTQLATPVSSVPKVAPEIYPGLRGPEAPPEFVKRVYGRWLGQLDRPTLRHLDPVLSQAITNWRRKNEWPEDVPLPSRGEETRRVVEAGPEAVTAHIGKFTGAEAVRAADRLRKASQNQK